MASFSLFLYTHTHFLNTVTQPMHSALHVYEYDFQDDYLVLPHYLVSFSLWKAISPQHSWLGIFTFGAHETFPFHIHMSYGAILF